MIRHSVHAVSFIAPQTAILNHGSTRTQPSNQLIFEVVRRFSEAVQPQDSRGVIASRTWNRDLHQRLEEIFDSGFNSGKSYMRMLRVECVGFEGLTDSGPRVLGFGVALAMAW